MCFFCKKFKFLKLLSLIFLDNLILFINFAPQKKFF